MAAKKKRKSKKGKVPAGLARYQKAQRAKKRAAKAAAKGSAPKKRRKKAAKKAAPRKTRKKASYRGSTGPSANPFGATATAPKKRRKASRKTSAKRAPATSRVIKVTADQILGRGMGKGKNMRFMPKGEGHLYSPSHPKAMKSWLCQAAKPRGCGGGGRLMWKNY